MVADERGRRGGAGDEVVDVALRGGQDRRGVRIAEAFQRGEVVTQRCGAFECRVQQRREARVAAVGGARRLEMLVDRQQLTLQRLVRADAALAAQEAGHKAAVLGVLVRGTGVVAQRGRQGRGEGRRHGSEPF